MCEQIHIESTNSLTVTRNDDGVRCTWYNDDRGANFDNLLATLGIEGVECWGGGFATWWQDKKKPNSVMQPYDGKFTKQVKWITQAAPHAHIAIVCTGNDIYPGKGVDMVDTVTHQTSN